MTPQSQAAFNATNNRLSLPSGYDTAGNLTTNAISQTFAYDAENRQTSFNTGNVLLNATYQYDGDGHRVRKDQNGVTTVFVYDAAGQLAAEYSSASASGSGGTSYPVGDHLGSSRIVTDSNQAVLARHDYLPFGEEIQTSIGSRSTITGYTTLDPIRQKFTAKERDTESGLDYFLARYYSSPQGRFTSPDEFPGGIVDPFTGQQAASAGPLPYADIADPQTLNKYSYVRNNPLRYTDPDGHVIDTLADIGFILYDLYEIRKSGATSANLLALGADVVGAALPFATGLGAAVRVGHAVEAGAKAADGAVLTVKLKESWSAAQKLEAAAKIEALNKTEMVVTKAERSATSAASRYKKAGGTVNSKLQDVDHIQDLQLGGKETVGNMKPIDKSVNRSLGRQIQNEIKRKGLKEGDKVCRIDVCP